jgi:hypothetical protein
LWLRGIETAMYDRVNQEQWFRISRRITHFTSDNFPRFNHSPEPEALYVAPWTLIAIPWRA